MKFKTIKELLAKFAACPVCDAQILPAWYCFGGDVGIHNGEIHISDTNYNGYTQHVNKFKINIETNRVDNKASPRTFDLACEQCHMYMANFLLSIDAKKAIKSELVSETIKFSHEGKLMAMNKNYAKRTVVISHGGQETSVSKSFLKMNDYKGLDRRFKSLLLFDE